MRTGSFGALLILGCLAASYAQGADPPWTVVAVEQVPGPTDRLSYDFWLFGPGGVVDTVPSRLTGYGSGAVGLGDTGPILSPDGLHLAYAQTDSLFLIDLRSKVDTVVYVEPEGRHILITDWNPDSHQILFFARHPRHRWTQESLEDVSAFRIYDLVSATTTTAGIPAGIGVYEWVDSTSVLVNEGKTDGTYQVYDLHIGSMRPVPIPSHWGQVQLTGATAYARAQGGSLVRVHLDSGATDTLAWETSPEMILNAPTPSPSGEHLAYVVTVGSASAIAVDGRPVLEDSLAVQPFWIDDGTLAIWRTSCPIAIDAFSGERLYGCQR